MPRALIGGFLLLLSHAVETRTHNARARGPTIRIQPCLPNREWYGVDTPEAPARTDGYVSDDAHAAVSGA